MTAFVRDPAEGRSSAFRPALALVDILHRAELTGLAQKLKWQSYWATHMRAEIAAVDLNRHEADKAAFRRRIEFLPELPVIASQDEKIRLETPSDHETIYHLTKAAFEPMPFSLNAIVMLLALMSAARRDRSPRHAASTHDFDEVYVAVLPRAGNSPFVHLVRVVHLDNVVTFNRFTQICDLPGVDFNIVFHG
ncbi:hypothetical protein [Mesorhizobium sp. WSM2239]|uniref:Uncharacterized protein n=2 Tax=unclassified Mesorhizobium TaxID=325217 RepID=A0AAU8DFW8_9HYPH